MEQYEQFIETYGLNRVTQNEPLAPHTTFKVGGPADLYSEAETTVDLVEAVRLAIKLNIPHFVFGGGSNMLVSDKGIRGLVIRNKSKQIRVLDQSAISNSNADDQFIEADTGLAINYIVRYAIDNNMAGIETFLGLPGTLGGAIWNNSHYRQPKNEFIGNVVHSVKLLDAGGSVREVSADYFQFAYDYSILHETNEIALSAILKLKPGNKEELMQIAAQESVQKRHKEQPLEKPSSGCTFQNISKEDATRLQTPNGTQSAGYIIDQAGLKGLQVGKAMVSEKHANFIVNIGGATANDIKVLAEQIRQKVQEKFGVTLQEEIHLVGEW